MKLIESKAEYLPQEKGLAGIYKQIEKCGRVCYKSEAKCDGTKEGAEAFVQRIIKSGHTAMLEHGTIYIVEWRLVERPSIFEGIPYTKIVKEETNNSNSKCKVRYHITTNLRVAEEHSLTKLTKTACINGLGSFEWYGLPTTFHEPRYTFKFICSRSIANELVRHRVFSFAQESTRFCNYSKDKFGNELTFIEPSFIADKREFKTSEAYDNAYEVFCSSCEEAEGRYMLLLEKGFTPQQVREVLPLSLKTELCMTGFASDWCHLIDLRLFGKTGNPHPDMVVLMEKFRTAAQEAGIWDTIMSYKSKFE